MTMLDLLVSEAKKLTDEVMEIKELDIRRGNGEVSIDDPQFGRVFKWVDSKTEIEQYAAKSLVK